MGEQWETFSGFATVFRAELLDGPAWRTLPPSAIHRVTQHHDEIVHEVARLRGRRLIVHELFVLYRQHATNTAGVAPQRTLRGRVQGDATTGLRRKLTAAQGLPSGSRRVPRSRRTMPSSGTWGAWVAKQARRRAVHDTGLRPARAAALARGLGRDAYRSRTRDDVGLRGLAKDASAVAHPARP